MAEKSPSASLVRSIEADDREARPALASDATPARRFITISNTCPTISGESPTEGWSNIKREPARGIEWQISVVDPLGGSYYVEALTNEHEKRIFAILDEVDKLGGTIKLIEEGWFQKHIADFADETALRKQSGEKPVLGVNRYQLEGAREKIEVHPYDPTTAERQIARTRRVRAERDETRVQALLDKLAGVARNPDENIMPVTVELVRAGATMGDIVEKLKGVWGVYRVTPVS
jgi:methylmalonyl-CoA mutase cobalamin-binding domain/chain